MPDEQQTQTATQTPASGGQSGEQPPAASQPQQATPATVAAQQAGQAGSDAAQQQAASEKVEDLPEWAQRIIRDTRGEAAANRTKATEAEQQRQATLDAIAKALGLKDEGEQPDPAQLAQQLTDSQAQARQSAVELAVYKTAGKHSGDPDALLDSRTFIEKVAALDPSADDFAAKVDDAIKQAVADNPKLKATRAVGSSSVDHAGGTGEGRTPANNLTGAIHAHYGA